MSGSTMRAPRLDQSAAVTAWRAAESRRKAQRRSARARPWPRGTREGIAALIGNGTYAGVRVAARKEGASNG